MQGVPGSRLIRLHPHCRNRGEPGSLPAELNGIHDLTERLCPENGRLKEQTFGYEPGYLWEDMSRSVDIRHGYLVAPEKKLFFELDVDTKLLGVPVGDCLDLCYLFFVLLWFEQVAEPLLLDQVLLDRFADNLLHL